MQRKSVTWSIAVIGVLAAAANLFILLGSRQAATASSAAQESSSQSGDADSSDWSGSSDSSDSSSSTGTGAFTDGTYTGSTVTTRHGDIQVQVEFSGGKITTVTAVKYPDGDQRSSSISQQIIPQLVSEAVSAQSSDITMVSGATITSEGFINSLQDAINQAEQG